MNKLGLILSANKRCIRQGVGMIRLRKINQRTIGTGHSTAEDIMNRDLWLMQNLEMLHTKFQCHQMDHKNN